jgi:hypothetical protein
MEAVVVVGGFVREGTEGGGAGPTTSYPYCHVWPISPTVSVFRALRCFCWVLSVAAVAVAMALVMLSNDYGFGDA